MFIRARLLIFLFLILGLSVDASSATYKKLISFLGTQAQYPNSGLIFDNAGNAYGTTEYGGYGKGIVYQLSPTTGFSIIYAFRGEDGYGPFGNLALDAQGNLYGTTYAGGGSPTCIGGCGEVFQLSPPINNGHWTLTVIYSFTGSDGRHPHSGIIFDQAGNIYGTTQEGGIANQGTVFELSPTPAGWTETVLYNFTGGDDGATPFCSLIFDTEGNLFGTAAYRGLQNAGTVFELSPQGNGIWTYNVIYSFGTNFSGGETPEAGLIFDDFGNLYGTAANGGVQQGSGYGTVFELTPSIGVWKETAIHKFDFTDGSRPAASLTFADSGNLFGTTQDGGQGAGTVFELVPPVRGGRWTEQSFAFPKDFHLGVSPLSPVSLDQAGRVYGTTVAGGEPGGGYGVVFQITP